MVYRNSPKGDLINWLVTVQLLLLKAKIVWQTRNTQTG